MLAPRALPHTDRLRSATVTAGLASGFDHDWVLLFTFPNNDFLENDPDRFWQRDRYRPYLRRTDRGDFELFYPIGLDEAKRRATDQLWWNRWYNAIFVYRLIAFFDAQVRVRLSQGPTGPHGYIGYQDFSDEDLERLLYGYRAEQQTIGTKFAPRKASYASADFLGSLKKDPKHILIAEYPWRILQNAYVFNPDAKPLISRLDAYTAQMQAAQPYLRLSRADVLRMLLDKGLQAAS